MSYEQYPNKQDFIVLPTGAKQALGIINLAADTELAHILLTVYKVGTLTGSEQLKINLYSSDRYDSAFGSSSWVSISDITNISTITSWLGWLRFDFARLDLDKDEFIYAEIETQNYTRNGETFYIGIGLDWPVLVNTFTAEDGAPAALQIFGYK